MLLPAVCTGTGAFSHEWSYHAYSSHRAFAYLSAWNTLGPGSLHSSLSSQLSSQMFRKAFPCSLSRSTISISCIYSTIHSSFTALLQLNFYICLYGFRFRTTLTWVSVMGVSISSVHNHYVCVCVSLYPQYPGQCLWPECLVNICHASDSHSKYYILLLHACLRYFNQSLFPERFPWLLY